MAKKKIHLMVIGAHIGDAEITAGHVIAKHTMAGHRATMLHMTAGEKGHPKLSPAEYEKQKRRETEAAAKVLGCQVRVMPYKDGELPCDEETKLTLCDVIRESKPDVVLTHWQGSFHKDHINTHKLVTEALFYAAVPGIKRSRPAHSVANLYYTDNWEDELGYEANAYMDISGEPYRVWLKAIEKHALFRGEVASFPYKEYYQSLTVTRGARSGYQRAVSFMVPRYSNFQRLERFPVEEQMLIF